MKTRMEKATEEFYCMGEFFGVEDNIAYRLLEPIEEKAVIWNFTSPLDCLCMDYDECVHKQD